MPRKTINPEGLFDSRKYGFSQIAIGEGRRVVTISGQVGWDKDERIVSADLKQQTMQALQNLKYAMEAAGGSLDDVLLLHIYIVESVMTKDLAVRESLQAFFPVGPPATSWIGVPRLSVPDFLVEIEAIGVLP
ncbi:MAG TPA: RidA family protein [Candidatus Eisenbacteria bacterium]|nr:RidA family protein [Candidatus Eisenbacteria bacterium]